MRSKFSLICRNIPEFLGKMAETSSCRCICPTRSVSDARLRYSEAPRSTRPSSLPSVDESKNLNWRLSSLCCVFISRGLIYTRLSRETRRTSERSETKISFNQNKGLLTRLFLSRRWCLSRLKSSRCLIKPSRLVVFRDDCNRAKTQTGVTDLKKQLNSVSADNADTFGLLKTLKLFPSSSSVSPTSSLKPLFKILWPKCESYSQRFRREGPQVTLKDQAKRVLGKKKS